MITNTGKNILAKYLVGQAPAYASYIAVGCGAKPLSAADELGNYSRKESLDFEMFRVPIISRGYVTEELESLDEFGQPEKISKIVLTAELPTEERYEISEVGVYSAASNPSAGSFGSRTVYSFSQSENWEYHTSTTSSVIPVINVLNSEENQSSITITDAVFQTNSDNQLFTQSSRVLRNERCRFLNSMIVMRGDDATFTVGGDGSLTQTAGNHIHLTGINLDFSRNAPTDQLKLAFSVINKDGLSSAVPDSVRILIEFASAHDSSENGYQSAKFVVNISDGATYDFDTNRYVVVTKQLQELFKTSNFTWSSVRVVKVSASVIDSGEPSDDFYVCLDALRLENVSTINPLYGLTGYSVIKNSNALPIIKAPNTENYIEFRFAMDVQ
jgi:hypothetical protein